MENANWSLIPEHGRSGLRRYIENGTPPGSFLMAILENDLRGAFTRADHINEPAIGRYVAFLYQFAPSPCWGSARKVSDWCEKGGLFGIANSEAA